MISREFCFDITDIMYSLFYPEDVIIPHTYITVSSALFQEESVLHYYIVEAWTASKNLVIRHPQGFQSAHGLQSTKSEISATLD